MTAEEYIKQRLKRITDESVRPDAKLAHFIFATIMSKKFRKYSVNPAANDMVSKAIELNIQNQEPIKIAIPFGSYKLWRLEESPEPDWAELFAMIYYAYWLKPITDVYEQGVWFDFCGDDAILELMNNIPEEDTGRYKRVFGDLIDFMRTYLPKNFKYTFSPVGERYGSKKEFLDDLNEKVQELEQKGGVSFTERDMEMMKFNIKPAEGKEIDFQKNRILHDAYMAVSKRRPHHKRPDKILISATPFGDRTSIPIGTTKTSVVKFQTGAGVLKESGDGFMEYIYSPSQLEQGAFKWEDVQIQGLSGKNFSRIRVL
ncbi:MAG: hypothetical protein AAB495_04330 [Patescibacteria group bacterium]